MKLKLPVRYLEVYSDIFFVGKNFNKKLDKERFPELDIFYDQENDWFELHYKGRIGYTKQNSAFWEFETGAPVTQIVNTHKPMDTNKIKGAQVSGPTDHVFQGEGAGMTKRK